jgi:MoaA/NifB/PqqE/SkfB family radical SAM enzyme
VTPYGDISSCDFNHRIFGNVLREPLHAIWDRMTSDKAYEESKWGGCKVKDSEFIATRMNGAEKACVSLHS